MVSLAAPKPDNGVKATVQLGCCLPPVFIMTRRRLMDDRASIEELARADEIRSTIGNRSEPFVFVPRKLHRAP